MTKQEFTVYSVLGVAALFTLIAIIVWLVNIIDNDEWTE